MLLFVLKTADEKQNLRYHFIKLMYNVFKFDKVAPHEFTGRMSKFKWPSRCYLQVGGGKNLNFELSETKHNLRWDYVSLMKTKFCLKQRKISLLLAYIEIIF